MALEWAEAEGAAAAWFACPDGWAKDVCVIPMLALSGTAVRTEAPSTTRERLVSGGPAKYSARPSSNKPLAVSKVVPVTTRLPSGSWANMIGRPKGCGLGNVAVTTPSEPKLGSNEPL